MVTRQETAIKRQHFVLYRRIVHIPKLLVDLANVYLASIVTLCSHLKNEKFSVFLY